MEVIDGGLAEEGAGNRNAKSVADEENPKTPFVGGERLWNCER